MKGSGIRELKSLSLEIQEVTSKNIVITEKKENNVYVRQIIYTNQGHLSTKVTPVNGFTNEPVIQCNVPVVENNFVDDSK